jgi:hypothetical protein
VESHGPGLTFDPLLYMQTIEGPLDHLSFQPALNLRLRTEGAKDERDRVILNRESYGPRQSTEGAIHMNRMDPDGRADRTTDRRLSKWMVGYMNFFVISSFSNSLPPFQPFKDMYICNIYSLLLFSYFFSLFVAHFLVTFFSVSR